ncbi:PREDICTED: uncharacterized protein LOC109181125 [Ipomoea nil]|uniref:uncharacterized protein LOC109181125 n=1 Tax=Ipomoea nil TaxID=35883 RepID=UPI000901E78D|nr:PREDICTED: uncharacterized protein LOC109181125 [Ipomoea nil]
MEKEKASMEVTDLKAFSDQYFKSLPPGIRFRPTDGELVEYLKKKVLKEAMPLHRIKTCNIYLYHPNDICRPDDVAREKERYFFTTRIKKYPNGARPDRKAGDGYWKATGRDMPISCNGQLDECVLAKIYEKTTGSKKTAGPSSPSQDDSQQIILDGSEQLPPEEQDNPILEPENTPTAEQVAAPPPPQYPYHQNPMPEATAAAHHGYNTYMMIPEPEPLPLPPPEAQDYPILEPIQSHMAPQVAELPPFPHQENPMDEAAAAAAFYSWDAGSYGFESLQTVDNCYGINSGAFGGFEEDNNDFWGSQNGGLEDVVAMYARHKQNENEKKE